MEQQQDSNNVVADGSIKTLPTKVSAGISYVGMGKKDATKIQAAILKGETSMRNTLYERGAEFEGIADRIDGWLKGFGEVMGKTKKSEARAVFEAMAYDAEKLHLHKGDFNSWVKLAREIRNAAEGKNDPNAVASVIAPKAATKKQADTVIDKIGTLNKVQTEAALSAALNQLPKVSKVWENTILTQIESLANQLKKSEQPIFQNAGADLIDLLEPISEKIAIESAIAESKMENTAESAVASEQDQQDQQEQLAA